MCSHRAASHDKHKRASIPILSTRLAHHTQLGCTTCRAQCINVCVCVCVCWAIGHGVHDACMYGVYVTVYACSYIRLCSNTHSYILGLYKWRFTHTDMPCIFLLIFDCQ